MAGREIEFFTVDYSTEHQSTDSYAAFGSPQTAHEDITFKENWGSGGSGNFEDEPPLWEELGFDPQLIKTKTIAILGRKSLLNELLINDTDLGGPLVYCIVLGCALILGGKVHFGYIFGYSIMGSLLMWMLLNLMSERGIGVSHTMSVLGYSLPPMILLALISLVLPPTSILGVLVALAIIAYCTHSASYMFTRVLMTVDEGALFAYPIGLLYTCFALIVMF